MARSSKKHPPLRVLLNGRDVGMLTRAPSGAIELVRVTLRTPETEDVARLTRRRLLSCCS